MATLCAACGTALSDASLDPPTASAAIVTDHVDHEASDRPQTVATVHGERRHLTVLFTDLVGSTAIAARLDPEEWHSIASQYQSVTAQAVKQFGGHVGKYLGDGLVVYFGWPTANEDDAERAVRAGLAVVEAIAALNKRLAGQHGVTLSVRIGIDSGSVVMGRGGGDEIDVFGDPPNIAARVQNLGVHDAVLITGAVHDLVSGQFVVESLGARRLAGIEQPVQVYRVVQPSGVRLRWRRAGVRGPTPFVGRNSEMRLLQRRWERARAAEGQVVLVTGEPGIGKSRLVEEFRMRIKDDTHLWIECAGERFFEGTPFHVVAHMLDQGLGRRGDETEEQLTSQLERSLDLAAIDLAEGVPLIAEMLKLPAPKGYPPLALAPERRRSGLMATLAAWAVNLARLQPTVLVIEDLHWVDPSTLELLRTLIEQAAAAPLMLLCTARPEFQAPWEMRSHCAQVTLSRLSDDQTHEMIAGFAGPDGLTEDVIDSVVKRSDGVPFFAEELMRLFLGAGGRRAAREIPATLRDSLAARLDRLGPSREVAQVAAVLGREFSYELLEAVCPTPRAGLESALKALADAELIHTRGTPPHATYRFKHALTQDAAYEGLLRSKRRQLHGHVAATMGKKFPALVAAQPRMLARHWTEAGEGEPAVAAWMSAGDEAYARRAFTEAEDDYGQAGAVLNALPASPARDTRELELCSALVRVLQLTRGYSAPETVEAGARARTLSEKVGNLPQLVRQDARTWRAILVTGDYFAAAQLADAMLVSDRRGGEDSTQPVYAHNAQVQIRYYIGDLAGMEEHFARLSPLIDSVGLTKATSANVMSIGLAALGAWALGGTDNARERIARAVAFARETRNPYNLAWALYFEALLHRCLRDPRRTAACATRLLTLSEENSFSYIRDLARAMLGWSRAHLGAVADGVEMIRQALAGLEAAGAKVGIVTFYTFLAEAEAEAVGGATAQALATVEEALAANPQELISKPNALTLRARFRFELGQAGFAEGDYLEAIAIARQMGAKAWELRAATGLANLLHARGDSQAALERLAPLYAEFTEGLGTPDLRDARALLGRLGARPKTPRQAK